MSLPLTRSTLLAGYVGVSLWALGACTNETIATNATGGTSQSVGGAPATGGVAAGGNATSSGGRATGGVIGTGGISVATGGKASGGNQNASGGRSSGGTASGGTASGGRPTGGTSTGGKATGGAATGGTSAGGTLNWDSAAYSATMFGNVNSGDCTQLQGTSFSDGTNISASACVAGTRTVTLNAENSKWYGAPGDLSTIWQGAQCTCQGGGTGACSTAPSCADEQDCGKCFAVKCDPNSTAKYSNGDTRSGTQYCNSSQYVVIQIIDACPHNHPSNSWWCTSSEPNHIDVSCSALVAITGSGYNAGNLGWLGVRVAPVACSVGLGIHAGQG
jgi:hypothetical protein